MALITIMDTINMPTYDYHCDSNQQTIEVRHKLTETINTWGELCAKAGIKTGDTSIDAKVNKLISVCRIGKAELPRFDPSILPK